MRRILRALLLIAGLATCTIAAATAQIPDKIVLNGKEYSLNTNPLGPYLREMKWKAPEKAVISSANWRGHVATWEISDNKLILKDVTIRVWSEERETVTKSILRDIFPGGEAIVATWFSGALIIPDGKRTQYVHMGYGSMYSHYQIARISKGNVTELVRLTGEEFSDYKDKKFQAFIGTDEYKKARAELLKDGSDMTPAQLDDFMKSFYAEDYLAL